MKATKTIRMALCGLCLTLGFTAIASLGLASCSSTPEWADPEAHERTEQLREQYAPLLVGTWHYEHIGDRQRFFEQLTFRADNTLTGLRRWQSRQVVTVDGESRYTDWQDIEGLQGTFSGTWSLRYCSPDGTSDKADYLLIDASFDEEPGTEWNAVNPFPYATLFGYANDATLCIKGQYYSDIDGWTHYRRGVGEPSF